MGHRGAELDFDAQQDRPKQWATNFEARPVQLKSDTPSKLVMQPKQEAPLKRGMLLMQPKQEAPPKRGARPAQLDQAD
jgi:hypothetical protein